MTGMKKLDEAGQTGMPGIVLSSDRLGLVPERWYCVGGIGMAMLCVSMADALGEAEKQQRDYPRSGPYRAMMLGDVAAERERWLAAIGPVLAAEESELPAALYELRGFLRA